MEIIVSFHHPSTLVLQGCLHDLLRKTLYLLVNFTSEGNTIGFEPIINYECKLQLPKIVHNDVVYRLFSLTFEEEETFGIGVIP
jgi:hypothetical protein